MAKNLFRGVAASLLSALFVLVLAYLVGVVVIAANTKEFFPTLLAAATVLPLMMLFVLVVPTLLIAVLVGVSIGITANKNSLVYLIGAVAGLLFGVAVLSGVLPLIAPGDFTSIVSRPLLAAVYALVLGLIAARIFRWFSKA